MESEDVQALFSSVFGTPGVVTTGPAYPPSGGPLSPPVKVEGPITLPSPGVDYAKVLSTIGKVGMGIGVAGRDIAGYRAGQAEAKIAKTIAANEAYQSTQRGIKLAGRARAVAGAQGTTGAGSPLIAELNIIQGAQTEARQRLYEGNIEAYYARTRAKESLYKIPSDLLSVFGTSLLTGK